MQLFTSSVGRKVLMAITGQVMVLFVIVHMLGNSSIFIPGGINAYAEHLHALPPLVWGFRLVMLVAAGIHILFGIQLSLENRAANPDTYAVKNYRRATMGSLSMLYTGLLLLSFIIYHLLHFTIRATPDIKIGVDSLGRIDVFGMVTNSFSHGIIAFIYIAAWWFCSSTSPTGSRVSSRPWGGTITSHFRCSTESAWSPQWFFSSAMRPFRSSSSPAF